MTEKLVFGFPVVESGLGDQARALSEIKLEASLPSAQALVVAFEAIQGDIAEAARLATEAFGHLSWAFADVMAGVMAGIKQVNGSMMELVLDDEERERCYRAYAAQLNHHRQWRLVSWRRLNRDQRSEAAALWWSQHYQLRE